MKKLKYLVVLLAAILIIPFTVYAEDEEEYYEDEVVEEANENQSDETNEGESTSDASKEVKIYFFRGEGCSHCAEAEEWFNSIEEEYGSLFEVVDYETWYNEDNAKLMQDVAEVRGETAEGVPYIVIGDKSWNGFAETYKDGIIEQIKKVFEQDVNDRYDVMNYLDILGKDDEKEEKSSNDVLSLILILLVTGGIGFGIYQARKKTN